MFLYRLEWLLYKIGGSMPRWLLLFVAYASIPAMFAPFVMWLIEH
jgi:hypothetical protein